MAATDGLDRSRPWLRSRDKRVWKPSDWDGESWAKRHSCAADSRDTLGGLSLSRGHLIGSITDFLTSWEGQTCYIYIVTDIHLEHNLEKIKQDRCRERTSHLEHHQISHLEHPVLYWITPCPAETSHLEHPVDIIINIALKHIYVDCSSQLVECHWYHTLGKLHT